MSSHDWDLVHSERDVLLGYLSKMRKAVVATGEGLTDLELRAPGTPSGTNLMGIVHHLAGVEEHWFQFVFLGRGDMPEAALQAPADTTWERVVADYHSACAESDAIVRSCDDLSTLSAIANPGEEGLDSLRAILAHMIEETARHAGQADIVRELLDGTTND